MTDEPDIARRRLLLAGLALGVITPAEAQSMRNRLRPDPAEMALLSTGTLAYVTSVHALQVSRNPDVQRFAQSEIAEQQGISQAVTGSPTPNAPLTPEGRAILAEARQTPPPAADRLYIGRQIQGHQQLYALATSYAANGPDRRVAAIAQSAVPLIQNHLGILNQIYPRVSMMG